MRTVIQRVTRAKVVVDENTVSEIEILNGSPEK